MCINPIKINGQTFPCGKCVECSMVYQNSLAIRCSEESKDWLHTYLITLTYDDEHLPTTEIRRYYVSTLNDYDEEVVNSFDTREEAEDFIKTTDSVLATPITDVFEYIRSYLAERNNPKANALYQSQELLSCCECPIRFPTQRKGDFQTFINSLRKNLERQGNEKVKYLYCSEYGENTWRPHYHCILFTNIAKEEVIPMVSHYWKHGFVDMHEITDVYKGNQVSKHAAFMYASKYVCKPNFMLNPLEKLGLVSPCFRSWSKGLGQTYRKTFKDKAQRIIDTIDSSLTLKRSDESNIVVKYRDGEYKKAKYLNVNRNFDLSRLYDKDVISLNGVDVQLFDDLFNECKYLCVSDKKLFKYNLPRYFKEAIIPKKKVLNEEIDYETGEVLEKILQRVDDQVVWYNLYKTYVQYRHIQDVYRNLLADGSVSASDSYGSRLFQVRVALSKIDEDRVLQSYKKSYKRQTHA